ncbi:MAG: hypothetical protein HY609_07095, partial [Deltaproteobacteria bacterium]|nr:hypothetical protein [Deltaproteobacteria bacterium]
DVFGMGSHPTSIEWEPILADDIEYEDGATFARASCPEGKFVKGIQVREWGDWLQAEGVDDNVAGDWSWIDKVYCSDGSIFDVAPPARYENYDRVFEVICDENYVVTRLQVIVESFDPSVYDSIFGQDLFKPLLSWRLYCRRKTGFELEGPMLATTASGTNFQTDENTPQHWWREVGYHAFLEGVSIDSEDRRCPNGHALGEISTYGNWGLAGGQCRPVDTVGRMEPTEPRQAIVEHPVYHWVVSDVEDPDDGEPDDPDPVDPPEPCAAGQERNRYGICVPVAGTLPPPAPPPGIQNPDDDGNDSDPPPPPPPPRRDETASGGSTCLFNIHAPFQTDEITLILLLGLLIFSYRLIVLRQR